MTSWLDFIFGLSVGLGIAALVIDIVDGWRTGSLWALVVLVVVITANVIVRVWATSHTPATKQPSS